MFLRCCPNFRIAFKIINSGIQSWRHASRKVARVHWKTGRPWFSILVLPCGSSAIENPEARLSTWTFREASLREHSRTTIHILTWREDSCLMQKLLRWPSHEMATSWLIYVWHRIPPATLSGQGSTHPTVLESTFFIYFSPDSLEKTDALWYSPKLHVIIHIRRSLIAMLL